MIVFDYIFYRLNRLYSKKEKDGTPIFNSSMYVTFLQWLTLYSLVMTLQIITNEFFRDLGFTHQQKKLIKAALVLVFTIWTIANYFRYKKKLKNKSLQNTFDGHPINKLISPWMFYVFAAILFTFPILVSMALR
jgi:magnesium-transporting ATPase (P-type)